MENQASITISNVFTDEDLEALTPEQKAQWKGYTYHMTYETWDEEAIECGETDDKGFTEEGSEPYETLDDLLHTVASDANWEGWSSTNPSPRDWINSYGESDPHTGERTNHSLWIERADGEPINVAEQVHISNYLKIRHPESRNS
jgi:hypothetical protein